MHYKRAIHTILIKLYLSNNYKVGHSSVNIWKYYLHKN